MSFASWIRPTTGARARRAGLALFDERVEPAPPDAPAARPEGQPLDRRAELAHVRRGDAEDRGGFAGEEDRRRSRGRRCRRRLRGASGAPRLGTSSGFRSIAHAFEAAPARPENRLAGKGARPLTAGRPARQDRRGAAGCARIVPASAAPGGVGGRRMRAGAAESPASRRFRADGGGLLNRYRGNTPIVGSNPIPSASLALRA